LSVPYLSEKSQKTVPLRLGEAVENVPSFWSEKSPRTFQRTCRAQSLRSNTRPSRFSSREVQPPFIKAVSVQRGRPCVLEGLCWLHLHFVGVEGTHQVERWIAVAAAFGAAGFAQEPAAVVGRFVRMADMRLWTGLCGMQRSHKQCSDLCKRISRLPLRSVAEKWQAPANLVDPHWSGVFKLRAERHIANHSIYCKRLK
jgi:hypothetical protein